MEEIDADSAFGNATVTQGPTTESDSDEGTSTTQLVLALGLFLLMVGVGASCKIELLCKMFQSPKALKAAGVGVLCQFLLMPTVAYLLTKIFQIEPYASLGFFLAGSMPGGSSSNVFVMWSGGILELSVFMTILSTFVSFGMTPLLIWGFANSVDDVGESSLAIDQIAISMAMLVIPLSIGVSLNIFTCLKRVHHCIEKGLGILACIVFVAAIVVLATEYTDALRKYATWQVYVSAVVFFPIAAGLSYLITTCLKFKPRTVRTVLVEVGLQNLALAFAIGENQPLSDEEFTKALPFPLLYAMFQYFWCAVLVPLSLWQKRRNEEQGIEDVDLDFFLIGEDDTGSENGEEVKKSIDAEEDFTNGALVENDGIPHNSDAAEEARDSTPDSSA